MFLFANFIIEDDRFIKCLYNCKIISPVVFFFFFCIAIPILCSSEIWTCTDYIKVQKNSLLIIATMPDFSFSFFFLLSHVIAALQGLFEQDFFFLSNTT